MGSFNVNADSLFIRNEAGMNSQNVLKGMKENSAKLDTGTL
jgi:hypothetical protein